MNTQQASISKISPLKVGKVMPRKRLFNLLDRKFPTRAYWISGPGGSGKTTFIASYLKERGFPSLWYQVDAMDRDPATFFYYLGQAATSLMAPDVPPMPVLASEYHANVETFILRYFETLYHRIKPGSWLIFDNIQDAPDDSPLLEILASAVQQLPENITLAMISRSSPPPVVSRFIANRTIKPIGRNQIAFSQDEFVTFLDFIGRRIDKEESKLLYDITRGWIAGAILWLLHSENEATNGSFPVTRTPNNIFDYFAAEIFAKTAPATRNFLLQTALLPHMTIDMAKELTNIEAEEILEGFSRKNFFIEKRQLPTPSYQYHPLFREFLHITAARVYSPSTLNAMCCRAASILEAQGWKEDAINLYCKADAYEKSAIIIIELAPALIAQGRYSTLFAWIESLPVQYTKKNPWLLFWKGLAQVTVNPPASLALCSTAFDFFTKKKDLSGQVLSWSTSIEIFFMLRGSFTDLDHWIREGERLGQLLSSEKDPPELSARFASSMLMALLLRDQGHPDLEKWQSRCELLLERCNDLEVIIGLMKNLFWSYHWIGQIHMAGAMEARLKVLQNSDDLPPMIQLTLSAIFTLAGVISGNHQLCLSKAEETLALANETGIHLYDFMILAYTAYTMLGTGKLDQLQTILIKLKASLMPFAVWDQGHYHFLCAWYAMQVGQLIKAQSEMATASLLIETCDNPFTIALSRLLQSQLHLELGEANKAEPLLISVINERRLGKSRTIHFIAKLACADTAYACSRDNEAEAHMYDAFSIARKHGLSMPFGFSPRRLSALCANALDAGIEKDMVIEVIRRWCLRAPTPEKVSDRWPWPIRIYTLGRFEILRDGKPMRNSSKPSRKPLELLAFLISVGEIGVSREKIANRLWPDSDGDRAIQNLNTTLHRLRKLLGHNESVILENNQLMLHPQICWIDCRHFVWLTEQLVIPTASLSKNKYLNRALELYRGPYTPGHENITVAVSYKEHIEKRWLNILAAALPSFVTESFVHRNVLQKALAVDATAASVLSLLMSAYSKQGRRSEALEIIRRCRELLAEQGIMLGARAESIFRQLTTEDHT